MSVLFGPLGALLLFLAYANRDNGFRAILLGFAALICFGAMVATTPKDGFRGDCFTEWDGRSNPIVCD